MNKLFNLIKKIPILLSFLTGIMIGTILAMALFTFKIMTPPDQVKDIVEGLVSDHPIGVLVFSGVVLIICLILVLILIIKNIKVWVEGGIKLRRTLKRKKRINQIKRYGYTPPK